MEANDKLSERELEQEESSEIYTPKVSKIGFGIHEILIITLILLNFFGFFNMLPNEIDFLEKFISWTLLGTLIYSICPSKLFFGKDNRTIDVIIILSYFGLIIKDLVMVAYSLSNSNSFFSYVYALIVSNSIFIEKYVFIISFSVIVLLSIYVAFNTTFYAPSLMHVIHEEGLPKELWKKIVRFFLTLLVFFGFFIIVFNLISEWLAIAGDDPLLIAGIFFYIFVAKKLTIGTKLEELGNMGGNFYTEVISLFHSKKKIWFALSGMLVLHILTDVANFMIPYLFSLDSTLYGTLGNHTPILSLLLTGISNLPDIFLKIILAMGYVMNVIGILILMISPALIWYRVYKQKEFDINPIFIFLFVSSAIYFLINPAFVVGNLESADGVVGADIKTQEISPNLSLLILSLLSGLVLSLVSKIEIAKRGIGIIYLASTQLFFIKYIFHYFLSISNSYLNVIMDMLYSSQYFFVVSMGLFYGIIIIFYVGSLIAYFIETWS